MPAIPVVSFIPSFQGELGALKVFFTLEPQRRKSLLVLFFAGLLFWASMASLLPTLPLYVEYVGGTKQQIGLVMGAFALGLLPSRAWLGPLADRRGRKIVLILGATVASLAPFGYLLVDSIPWLMVIRAFHGISIAAFTTGYSALVTDLSPPKQRGELLGYMSLVNPIGMALGPAIGGFLLESTGYPPLFLMSAGLGVLSLLFTTRVTEADAEPASQPAQSTTKPAGQKYWRLLFSPRVRIPSLVLFMIGLVFGTISTFVPLFMKETGVDLNPGLFYSAAAVASFTIRLPTGPASDRYGRGLFITGSLVCYCVSMLMLWNSYSPRDFLLAAIIEGAASGTLLPMMIALIADRSEPKERGRYFSLCIGGFDFALVLAGPILGAIAESVGYRNMFAIAAVIALLAFIIFITFSSKSLSHSLRFAVGREKDVYALEAKN